MINLTGMYQNLHLTHPRNYIYNIEIIQSLFQSC